MGKSSFLKREALRKRLSFSCPSVSDICISDPLGFQRISPADPDHIRQNAENRTFHISFYQRPAKPFLLLHFRTFPVWCRILGSFSHLLLVLNSSSNILFYCCFNSQFRAGTKPYIAVAHQHPIALQKSAALSFFLWSNVRTCCATVKYP